MDLTLGKLKSTTNFSGICTSKQNDQFQPLAGYLGLKIPSKNL